MDEELVLLKGRLGELRTTLADMQHALASVHDLKGKIAAEVRRLSLDNAHGPICKCGWCVELRALLTECEGIIPL